MDALPYAGCISNYAVKYPILRQLFWKKYLFPYIFLCNSSAILTREPSTPCSPKFLAMSRDPIDLQSKLNNDLGKIQSWLQANKM